MSADQKPAVIVPNFSFDPVDETPAKVETREDEIAKTREAFKKADYVPPEVKNEDPKPVTASPTPAASSPKPAKKKATAKPAKAASDEVPAFRRRRGRPSGDRKHRISMKTTEPHLAFMYGIADGRELVGAFEHALEALAREVQSSGSYDGRKVPADILKLAGALVSKDS